MTVVVWVVVFYAACAWTLAAVFAAELWGSWRDDRRDGRALVGETEAWMRDRSRQ